MFTLSLLSSPLHSLVVLLILFRTNCFKKIINLKRNNIQSTLELEISLPLTYYSLLYILDIISYLLIIPPLPLVVAQYSTPPFGRGLINY